MNPFEQMPKSSVHETSEAAVSFKDYVESLIKAWNTARPDTHDRRDAGSSLRNLVPKLEQAQDIESLIAILRESSSTMHSGARVEAGDALIRMIEGGKIEIAQLMNLALDSSIQSVTVRSTVKDVLISLMRAGKIDHEALCVLAVSDSAVLRSEAKDALQK